MVVEPPMTADALKSSYNKEEFLLRNLLQNIPDLIYFKDLQCRFIQVNPATAKHLGLKSPQEAIGKTDFDFFEQKEAKGYYADEQEIIQTGKPLVDNEESKSWPDGTVTWVSTTKMPLRNEKGDILGIFGIARDITARKLAEIEIQDSIRYAERIQKSMLNTHRHIQAPGLDAFFLYRPRDIVSGDFFWMAQRDGMTFVAVADCTGHGVPGAFMSLIGHSLLEEIVGTKEATPPNVILSLLHQTIRKNLNQSNEAESARDGMDVCLCVFHPDTKKLFFSGAKRPLYYTDGKGGIHVCRGDRVSIGGLQREDFRVFHIQTVDLKVGQTFYLTTDGYADQPSGTNEKFGSVRLRKLFQEIDGLTLKQKQERLEAALNAHQGEKPQRDDITLVGMEWRP
jgi:PAS domain S-box-containing protein